MATEERSSGSKVNKTRQSRSTKRKIRTAKIIEEFEKLDPDQKQELLLERLEGELIDDFSENDVEDDLAERSNFVDMINQRFDPTKAADLLVREILNPKSMMMSVDKLIKTKRVIKLPPRKKHDNSTDFEIYELRLMRQSIDKLPKIKTQADFIRIAMENFAIFAGKLEGLCLKVPDGEKLENHINNHYNAIKKILESTLKKKAKSTQDRRMENIILYYIAVLAARLFFHPEAKTWLRDHRDRLNNCSIMIQKLEAADVFGDHFYANKNFWKLVVADLDKEIMMIPGKIVDYSPLEPELTYIINYHKLLGYESVESLLFPVFRRFGAYKSINPGVINKSLRESILKRLIAYSSIRRVMIDSISGLDIPQGSLKKRKSNNI